MAIISVLLDIWLYIHRNASRQLTKIQNNQVQEIFLKAIYQFINPL